MKAQYVQFGSKQCIRIKCPYCNETALLVDGECAQCGAEVDVPEEITKFKVEVEAEGVRRPLSAKKKKEILEGQDHECYYCGKKFGSIVFRKGKPLRLRLHFDHMIPFAFCQNNEADNFVASCHVCNQIKSSHMYASIDDAVIKMEEIRRSKGYNFRNFLF